MKTVMTRLPDEERKLWKSYCKSKNISGAHTLRMFILQLINSNPKPVEAENETADKKITVRVTATEVNDIYKKIAEEGYPNKTAWATSVIRKALGYQVYSDKEISAIREANLELIAIGRNLNQIAHALNIEHRDGDNKVKLDFLQALDKKINLQVKQMYTFLGNSFERN